MKQVVEFFNLPLLKRTFPWKSSSLGDFLLPFYLYCAYVKSMNWKRWTGLGVFIIGVALLIFAIIGSVRMSEARDDIDSFSELIPKIDKSFKNIQIRIDCEDGEISEEKIEEIKRILKNMNARFNIE